MKHKWTETDKSTMEAGDGSRQNGTESHYGQGERGHDVNQLDLTDITARLIKR